MRRMLAVIAAALAAGCASSPPIPPPIEAFGSPPPDIEGPVKAYFENVLKDPGSAIYKFGQPYRAICAPLFSNHVSWAGWAVNVGVNAKNGFGGYVGMQEYKIALAPNGAVLAADQTSTPGFVMGDTICRPA